MQDGAADLSSPGFFSGVAGVSVAAGHHAPISNSAFSDLTTAVSYAGSGDFTHVVASGNRWGDPGGPYDPSIADGRTHLNPAGQRVGDWVDYSNWLGDLFLVRAHLEPPDLPPGAIVSENALARIFERHNTSIKRAVQRGELPPPTRLLGQPVWTAGAIIRHLERRLEAAGEEAERDARRFEEHRP